MFSLLSPSCCGAADSPFPLSALPEAQQVMLLGSALARGRSLLEPAETVSYVTRGSFQALLTPAVSLLLNHCHVYPIYFLKTELLALCFPQQPLKPPVCNRFSTCVPTSHPPPEGSSRSSLAQEQEILPT